MVQERCEQKRSFKNGAESGLLSARRGGLGRQTLGRDLQNSSLVETQAVNARLPALTPARWLRKLGPGSRAGLPRMLKVLGGGDWRHSLPSLQ